MLQLRIRTAVARFVLLASTSCTVHVDDLPDEPPPERAAPPESAASFAPAPSSLAHDDDWRAETPPAFNRIPDALIMAARDQPDTPAPLALAAAEESQRSAKPPVRLPGKAARRVIDEDLNEAENIFFTEEGRLFVSGADGIYEVKRRADGKFTKTDHFDGDCIVEGIVQNGHYLYGVCWVLKDLSGRAFFLGGELTANPRFRILGELSAGVIPNGMAVDPSGRVYVTYSGTKQIARISLASPLEINKVEIWVDGLPANGIKYRDGAMYVTYLDESLISGLVRIPLLADGSAGKQQKLFERPLTVLDDIASFEDGFVITDFLAGTLIFWSEKRGRYAETPAFTFYGPTSLAQGRPPMFDERELIIPEKGMFLVHNERRGDLLSAYELPPGF